MVRTLRQRIFRATQEGNLKKVRSLQKLMLKSYSNRLVSVRRVTQTNAGKNTAGMDGMVIKTPAARGKLVDALGQHTAWKAKPARRIYIPKANKKLRPLGIPVVIDRCLQAMVKNALEPACEAMFEGISYGFRPGRSAHDATGKIYLLARPNKSKKWILDADIKGAFDFISHEYLCQAIGPVPGKELIKQWLKAGYIEQKEFHANSTRLHPGGLNHRRVHVQSPAPESGPDSVHEAVRCAQIPEYRAHRATSLSTGLTIGDTKEASLDASV